MDRLPHTVRPMMATLRRGLPADEEAYGWELKWDGVRAIAYVEPGSVVLLSRNDKDISQSYPELSALSSMVDEPVILDGEIVALEDGRPDFGRLKARMHLQPTEQMIAATPVLYYVFDVLQRGERSLLDEPYTVRREVLERLDCDRDPVRTPRWWRGDGAAVLAASIDQGLEGIVGKPLSSRYRPGGRGPWIKVKNVRHQEVIVAGWMPGAGRRTGMIGSLILGLYEEHELRYIGNVGTGFTQATLRDLADLLAPLERDTSPFDLNDPSSVAPTARWVNPQIVGEVAFAEWTTNGQLRHPTWRGLRAGKPPTRITREP